MFVKSKKFQKICKSFCREFQKIEYQIITNISYTQFLNEAFKRVLFE